MRDFEPYYTEDGSIGLYSYVDNDVYHSKFGALTEAWEKFVLPANLDKLNNIDNLNVLDICYGIGYNTKALMSYLSKNYLDKQKNQKKILAINTYTDTIENDNIKLKDNGLCEYSEPIDINKKSFYCIDCLEIDKNLVKLSPLLKTVKTSEEIFNSIVPNSLSHFKLYKIIKNIFLFMMTNFTPKNKKNIIELLNLKFKNMHIKKEYKIHDYINYILIDNLSILYKNDYFDNDFKNIINLKSNKRFVDNKYLNYAQFNQLFRYNYSSKNILSAFLHNIYYDYLSLRYKKGNFKAISSLFKVNFFVNDARKSILSLNKHYDLIFIDAFTYAKAPQLWSIEFIAELYKRISSSGLLITYSNSAQVRKTLLDNKFYVGKIIDCETNKSIGTIASKDKNQIETPLNNYEIGLCNTKAGIPYHDPNLSFTKEDILALREYDFKHSNLLTSSQYIKARNTHYESEE